jgi:hypothetical protein
MLSDLSSRRNDANALKARDKAICFRLFPRAEGCLTSAGDRDGRVVLLDGDRSHLRVEPFGVLAPA